LQPAAIERVIWIGSKLAASIWLQNNFYCYQLQEAENIFKEAGLPLLKKKFFP